MDWQLFLVAVLVAGAACYLARQSWRTLTASRKGCSGGCGCHGKAAAGEGNGQASLIPANQLTLRRGPSAFARAGPRAATPGCLSNGRAGRPYRCLPELRLPTHLLQFVPRSSLPPGRLPKRPRRDLMALMMAGSRAIAAPAMRSLKPDRNFVAE